MTTPGSPFGQGPFRPGFRHTNPPSPGSIRRTLLVFALGIIGIVLLPAGFRQLADWLWFQDLGFERVFLTRIGAQWAVGVAAGLLAFGVLYTSVRMSLRGVALDQVIAIPQGAEALRALSVASARLIGAVALPITAIIGLFVGVATTNAWQIVLGFIHRQPFGTVDPIFSRDISYYVFTLPVFEVVIGLLTFIALLATAAAALVYLMRGHVRRAARGFFIEPSAGIHLGVLIAALLVLGALRLHFVSIPSLLLSGHTPLFGASYADLHVSLPIMRGLTVLALAAAAVVIAGSFRGRNFGLAAQAVAVYLGASLLGAVIPVAYQRLVVQANELSRESAQILHHIEATRRAWGIDSVDRRELQAEAQLTPADIAANRVTIDKVRLWDLEPLLQTFGQVQSIRTYYDFIAVDDDRYRIGGGLRQVMLSARELNTAALPTRTFINEHLTYTHGMGITLGPSNQVTPEGLPVLFLKDLPPVSSVPGLAVTRPQIYYGELSNTFVLAPTRQREFDYPAAGEGEAGTVYSAYAGKTGVRVNSFVRRLMFALRFGSVNILLSRDLTDSTRILFERNVKDRAERVLPFLRFDRDPYLVVTDSGYLKWVLDAYTSTSRYPYSQPTADGTNYMRNSVKVVIDAYDGDVKAYLADPGDPIIRTFASIYPGLIQPLSAMPEDLRRHLRYPEDLFRTQTALFATFHMSDPETFYHREDQWQIPGTDQAAQRPAGRTPSAFIRHMVMRLPGETAPEFILMRPFTPRQKDNLASWMVARNDGEHYGKLVVYRFPRQSLVFGPTQIVNRIDQDTDVSQQISLWDQSGSEVIRGELLVIPIEQSLIYVLPLYLRAAGGRIPELKRVIVAHEGQIAMAESLDAALTRLFGAVDRAGARAVAGAQTVPASQPVSGTDSLVTLTRRAEEHFNRARAAQRADDWATYGAEMRALGELLRRINAARPPTG